MSTPERFDAVVIGSGFGGSVTALRLAEAGWSVCVLERGRPFAPGSFGRTPRQVQELIWDPNHAHYGMFDVWSFSGVNAVVGSGLGGGSLIYANVMLPKDPETFAADGFPMSADALTDHYEAVAEIQRPERYPIAEEPYARTGKAHALLDSARGQGLPASHPPLAVRFRDDEGRNRIARPIAGDNVHGVVRETCRLCGECDVGCNYGAKSTLDLTYLSLAQRRGAQLRCLCEAHGLVRRDDGGWDVRYRQRLEGRDGHPPALLDPVEEPERTISAAHVVVAAGTVGSARLLLRNQRAAGLEALPIGRRFSANGDLLSFAYGTDRAVDMSFGPVITTSVDVPADATRAGRAFHVQDAGAPVFAMWLLHGLGVLPTAGAGVGILASRIWDRMRGERDTGVGDELARLLGASDASDHTLALLSMGRDVPGGRFTYEREDDVLDLDWSDRGSKAFFDDVGETVGRLVAGMGGRHGRAPWSHLVTVHPLGGNPMSAEGGGGVVDPFGSVFGTEETLHVADGSVVPGPVGPNPSFTIAALADRFAERMVARAAR